MGMRRIGAVVGLMVIGAVIPALPAGAARSVGPNQFFTGVVNGVSGNTIVPITIRMACFGPVRPGQTGHPMAGQTLAVHELFPPSTSGGSLGATGNDKEIGVFFGTPPPATPGAVAPAGATIFTRYDSPKPLPTSLLLPCGGTGTVWFTPIPVIPPSRSQAVSVQFVGQP